MTENLRKDVNVLATYNTLGIARITKIVADEAGVEAKRVVVNGAAKMTVENPVGANAGNLAGVTFDSAVDGGDVALSEYAYPEIEAADPIPLGSEVNVADAGGRIKVADEATAGTVITLVGVAEEEATAEGQRIMVNIKRFGQTRTV